MSTDRLTKGASVSRYERIEISVSRNVRMTASVKCVLYVLLPAFLWESNEKNREIKPEKLDKMTGLFVKH